jgi:hypothetical protein
MRADTVARAVTRPIADRERPPRLPPRRPSIDRIGALTTRPTTQGYSERAAPGNRQVTAMTRYLPQTQHTTALTVLAQYAEAEDPAEAAIEAA